MRRLVFIGELEPYQKEIDTVRNKQYRRLLEQADRYHDMDLPKVHPAKSTTYMGIAIINLALAYRLSGEERYLKDAMRFINTVLGYEKWGNAHLVNVDLSASWILFGLSLGYDWLKDSLSDEDKVRISGKLQHHAKIIYDYRRETYGSGWSTNFYQNHNWINMTGLAAAGYALQGECADATLYVEEAKEDFERVYSYMPEDGSNYEGCSYWRYGGMWLFVYAHLLKVQEGIDWFEKCDYLKNTFYYRLYQSCGDLKQQMNFGDAHDRFSSQVPCVYYKTAAEYKDGYAQTFANLVLKEFIKDEARISKVKPGILPEAAFEFLWYDPSVPEMPLTDLPLVRYFDDLGLISIRSSWDSDAKVLTMKCSNPGGKKQWQIGWDVENNENIHLLALSHHHPDNLSYIFANGNEYLSCEDGYNRNIMPDNHNVLLVDGMFTDATDVNDVYMSSVEIRQKQGAFTPDEYTAHVSTHIVDDSLVLYRAETTAMYPKEMQMQEVSRLLITDGLKFWAFADVLRSSLPHTYTVICNTDRGGQPDKKCLVYPMQTGDIRYRVLSTAPTSCKQYQQNIVGVMTTQEPDKVCRVSMQTAAISSQNKEKTQVFFEVFTFEDTAATVEYENTCLKITCDGKQYQIKVGEFNPTNKMSDIEIAVVGDEEKTYNV